MKKLKVREKTEKIRKGVKGSTVAYFWHIGASSNKKERSYVQCVSG